MKVYDITPKIHPGLGVFPGDTPFQRNISLDFKKGNHLLLSGITTTLHLGAHADSSSHYHAQGEGVEKRPLQHFLGKSQVISVKARKNGVVEIQDLKNISIQAQRILFSTNSFPNPDNWNEDFMGISPQVIRELHSKGCFLVGIDTPSVDPQDSKTLEAHQALYETKMSVLEGLILSQVPDGVYSLVALPLPIENADASPVRALLIESPDIFPEDLEIF